LRERLVHVEGHTGDSEAMSPRQRQKKTIADRKEKRNMVLTYVVVVASVLICMLIFASLGLKCGICTTTQGYALLYQSILLFITLTVDMASALAFLIDMNSRWVLRNDDPILLGETNPAWSRAVWIVLLITVVI